MIPLFKRTTLTMGTSSNLTVSLGSYVFISENCCTNEQFIQGSNSCNLHLFSLLMVLQLPTYEFLQSNMTYHYCQCPFLHISMVGHTVHTHEASLGGTSLTTKLLMDKFCSVQPITIINAPHPPSGGRGTRKPYS